MEKERERFIGAKRTVSRHRSQTSIFEKIKLRNRTDFRARTASLTALTTYRTAYLKAHYPHEFMAALMSLDHGRRRQDLQNMPALSEMKIAAPDRREQSRVKFAVTEGAIRFGLAAIRGVGSKPAEAIVATRESGGPFERLAEFCLRVGTQLISRRVSMAHKVRRLRFEIANAPRKPDAERPTMRSYRAEGAARRRRRKKPNGSRRRFILIFGLSAVRS